MSAHRFAVRVKPGADRDRVGGCWDGPSGAALVVAVSAAAVDGRANDAVRRVLAVELGVRRRQLSIRRGLRSRDKLLVLEPASPAVVRRLDELRAGG